MQGEHNTTPEQTQQAVMSKRLERKGRVAIEKTGELLERLQVEYQPIDSIQPNEYNPNRQDEHTMELLINSITDHGFTQPIIINAENVIVDGEHRWRAAQALGMAEIPIVKVDMSDEQMRIATISHNRARGSHDIELEVQVLRDLESLGALDWAQDSLMISDDEITKLLEDIPAPESLADEDFSTAWEPDKLYDQKDDDFLAQSETFTQELDKQHTRSMTPETLNRVREREQQIKAAKTEQDRDAAKNDKAFYRLSLVFHGDEAEMVKSVLGKEPAQRIVKLCRGL